MECRRRGQPTQNVYRQRFVGPLAHVLTRDLAERRAEACGVDRQLEQVQRVGPLAGALILEGGRLGELGQRGLDLDGVPRGPHALQPVHLW